MAILTAILGWVSQSWFGQLVSAGLQWFQTKQQEQSAANTAEQSAESQHQSDGAQSVADQVSSDAQNAALDNIEKQLDNPTPVVVTQEPKP